MAVVVWQVAPSARECIHGAQEGCFPPHCPSSIEKGAAAVNGMAVVVSNSSRGAPELFIFPLSWSRIVVSRCS